MHSRRIRTVDLGMPRRAIRPLSVEATFLARGTISDRESFQREGTIPCLSDARLRHGESTHDHRRSEQRWSVRVNVAPLCELAGCSDREQGRTVVMS